MGVIVVTGAAGALGAVVCRHLADLRHSVVGIDFAAEASEFQGRFVGSIDLTNKAEVDAAFAEASQAGPIEGLVNIAGGFLWETVTEGSSESWERMFRLNLLTAFQTCQKAALLLADGGSIINIGAAAALKVGAGMAPYAASKSGVTCLTESLAEELKPRGIRVNALLPSIIDTPANRRDMGDNDSDRWVQPIELAHLVAFLLSDRASAVTGASIPVTGRM